MLTIKDIAALTDESARQMLEKMRWPNGPTCAHCSSSNAKKMVGKTVRKGLYRCKDCNKQFTVTVNSIFEGSKVGLSKWLYVLARLATARKGVSALQIQREIGVSYRTAWFMSHRVRISMKAGAFGQVLQGTVEVDETYIGGKARGWVKLPDGTLTRHKRGRGTKKIPLMAMVERDGDGIRTKVLPDLTRKTFHKIIRKNVDPAARIMTDEHTSYGGIGKRFKGGHHTVNHHKKEYVRGDVSMNTIESFFATVKRSFATHHSVSKKHLPKYAGEWAFRWKVTRGNLKDEERMNAAIEKSFGRRLRYEKLVA